MRLELFLKLKKRGYLRKNVLNFLLSNKKLLTDWLTFYILASHDFEVVSLL